MQKHRTKKFIIPESIPNADKYNTIPEHVPHTEKYNTKILNTRERKIKIVSNKQKIENLKESKASIMHHLM